MEAQRKCVVLISHSQVYLGKLLIVPKSQINWRVLQTSFAQVVANSEARVVFYFRFGEQVLSNVDIKICFSAKTGIRGYESEYEN